MEAEYEKVYPALECDMCREVSDKVMVYHQRTSYEHKESNYVCLCPICMDVNDYYWDDLWAEYYRNCC